MSNGGAGVDVDDSGQVDDRRRVDRDDRDGRPLVLSSVEKELPLLGRS